MNVFVLAHNFISIPFFIPTLFSFLFPVSLHPVFSLSHLCSITFKHETSSLPGSFNVCHVFDVAASFTAIYLLCCFGISVTLLLTCLVFEK